MFALDAHLCIVSSLVSLVSGNIECGSSDGCIHVANTNKPFDKLPSVGVILESFAGVFCISRLMLITGFNLCSACIIVCVVGICFRAQDFTQITICAERCK